MLLRVNDGHLVLVFKIAVDSFRLWVSGRKLRFAGERDSGNYLSGFSAEHRRGAAAAIKRIDLALAWFKQYGVWILTGFYL